MQIQDYLFYKAGALSIDNFVQNIGKIETIQTLFGTAKSDLNIFDSIIPLPNNDEEW